MLIRQKSFNQSIDIISIVINIVNSTPRFLFVGKKFDNNLKLFLDTLLNFKFVIHNAKIFSE